MDSPFSMTGSVRLLSLSEALAEADKHRGGGRHRARELADRFAPAGQLVLRSFGGGEREALVEGEWFEACARIEREGFNWSCWHRPWLVPAVENERRHSPSTSLYVWEESISTVALALQLLDGTLVWRPVEAVVSLQRPA
jgi:hypothetical protein